MITWLDLLAAMVAMLTGLAMLKDTCLTHADRAVLRAIVQRAVHAARRNGLGAVDRAELSVAMRFVLRAGVLILIVASSGVSALETMMGAATGLYDALLKFGLAVFMAMQAPCPWLRWITLGDRRQDARPQPEGADRHVH